MHDKSDTTKEVQVMDNRVFPEDRTVYAFHWQELDKKNLQIIVGRDVTSNQVVVAGWDRKEDLYYILHIGQYNASVWVGFDFARVRQH